MINVGFLNGEDDIVPILRLAFRASGAVLVVALGLTVAPHAQADCTPTQWIDLCEDGGQGAYTPCVCNYMDDAGSSIDLSPDRPSRPPNRPDNSLPGASSPGGGGGGGSPIVGGGGGRGGGGGGRR